MECIREVVNSNLLDRINISVPQNLLNRQVEIIIMPFIEEKNVVKQEYTVDELAGCLEKYKNPDLIPLEKEAWGKAMVDKYGDN